MFCAIAFNTLPELSRVAIPLASAGNVGRFLSHPSGSSRCCMRLIWSASSGNFFVYSANDACHFCSQLMSAFADALAEIFHHAVGNQKLRVLRPAVIFLHQPHFFFAQGLAVRFVGILLVRRSVSDVAVHDDERGTIIGLQEIVVGLRQRVEIIRICDVNYVPAIALKRAPTSSVNDKSAGPSSVTRLLS